MVTSVNEDSNVFNNVKDDLSVLPKQGTQYTKEQVQREIEYLAKAEQHATGDTLKKLQAAQKVWVLVEQNNDRTPPASVFKKMPRDGDLPLVGYQYSLEQKLAAVEYLASAEQHATGDQLTKLQAESQAWINLPTDQS